MPKFYISKYNKETKKQNTRYYDTDSAKFICNVPGGRLLKQMRGVNFYIYNPRGKTKEEIITPLSYIEAKNLIKIHGTREQYLEYFTLMNPDGTFKNGKRTHIEIDEYHRIKLIRTASMLGMSLGNTVEFLIDKYDGNDNFYKPCAQRKKLSRKKPDPSEFTS